MGKVFDNGRVFDKFEKDLGKVGDRASKTLANVVNDWGKTARIKKVKIRDIQLGKKGR